jgi:hypothetical protein
MSSFRVDERLRYASGQGDHPELAKPFDNRIPGSTPRPAQRRARTGTTQQLERPISQQPVNLFDSNSVDQ